MYQSQIDYIYNIVQNIKNLNIYSKKIKMEMAVIIITIISISYHLVRLSFDLYC